MRKLGVGLAAIVLAAGLSASAFAAGDAALTNELSAAKTASFAADTVGAKHKCTAATSSMTQRFTSAP